MGGRKRPTVSQLEKRIRKEAETPKKEERGERKFSLEYEQSGAPTEASLASIEKEVSKWRYATPFTVASRFNIRISTAKRVLKALEEAGTLRLVDGNRRVRIYVPAK